MWAIDIDFATPADAFDPHDTPLSGMGGERIGDGGNGRVKFRLYDGDGTLYCQGTLDDDDERENQLDALRWGERYAGCATIKVLRRVDGREEWRDEIE